METASKTTLANRKREGCCCVPFSFSHTCHASPGVPLVRRDTEDGEKKAVGLRIRWALCPKTAGILSGSTG